MVSSEKNYYDILIIGAGPAGISTATILSKKEGKKVALVEAGSHFKDRYCFVDHQEKCKDCEPSCNIISGFGGSIHYGDSVKLSKFPAGKHLMELLGKEKAKNYMQLAIKELEKSVNNLNFVLPKRENIPFKNVKPYPVAPINKSEVESFIEKSHKKLQKAEDINIFFNTKVTTLTKKDKKESNFQVVCKKKGQEKISFSTKKVIFAGGRYGLGWWNENIEKLKIKTKGSSPSFGLRFEGPKTLFKEAGEIHPDLKLTFYKKGYKIKTFCFCGGKKGGRIKAPNYNSINLLDGHIIIEKPSNKVGNFALMMKNRDPDADNKKRVKEIMSKYKTINQKRKGKPVFQLYKDFTRGRKTKIPTSKLEDKIGFPPSILEIEPSNLRDLFTKEEHCIFCETFEQIFEWLYSLSSFPDNLEDKKEVLGQILVLGIEIEDQWDYVSLTPDMESSTKNLYVAGDATGIAQGILQAMVSGIAAAKGCLKK